MNIVNKKLLSILLSMALLLGLLGAAAPSSVLAASTDEPVVLLPGNSEWKYYDKGLDQGTVWRSTYDDTAWDSNLAPFGYKVGGTVSTSQFGPVKTIVDYGADSSKKYRTTYFRTILNVDKTKIDEYGQLLGNFAIDDGAVIYVNGTEIARFGLPVGEITYTTKAASSKDLPVIYTDIDLTAQLKTNLKNGNNEIAVEVHQQSDSSSDLYFDMKLTALQQAPTVDVSKVTVTFYGDSTSSKGFTWYTPQASSQSDVQVVEKTGNTAADFTNATGFTGRTSIATNSTAEHVHKAEATGLKADTSYFFRVGDADLNIWSETGTFQTAPTGGAFSFIDLTDTQAKEEDEAILSGSTLSKALATVPNAKFVIHNGDVVENGASEQEWNWLLGHSQDSLLNTTIVPASGNHDDDQNAFFEHFNVKQAENSATATGAYYSYDYSNTHFIVLNSNESSVEYANFSVDQVEWLKKDAQAAKAAGAEWIIVNIHKGPYTTSNHATDSDIIGTNGVRNKIAPLMNELGIDLVFQGHDHIYARTKPIKSDGTAETVEKITETLNGQTIEYAVKPDGTIYLIPATAGAKVYFKNQKAQLGDAYFNLFELADENHARKYGDTTSLARGHVQNFVGLTIDGGKLTAVSYEIDKNLNNGQPFIVDQFGISKETAPDYSKEKISKVTVTFNGDTVSAKGFAWYTSLLLKGNDVQVVEKTDGAPNFTKATAFQGRSTVSSNSASELVHKAEATGLKANTSYAFRVGDAALDIWSETGTFRTAPESGAFTFIDMADTQAKEEDEAKLSSETLAKALATVPNAQFVVHNGDLVDTGKKEEQWNWLLGHSQGSLLNTTIVPSAGNHEDENFAFFEHFNVKQAENSATETGAYYSYDYSNAHFIVLNSNEDSEQYANFSAQQVAWLKKDAQAAKAAGAQWIIVNIHKGPYTTSNHATDSDIMDANGVRNQIAPLMAELGIDFVVQGHDHTYARTKPIKKDGTAAATEKITETLNGQKIEYTVNPNGSIYMIPATAGPKVYYKNPSELLGDAYYNLFERAEENHAAKYGPDPKDNRRPVRSQVQNFVGITIDGNKFTAVTYEIDQNLNNAEPFIVDQFGIVKKSVTGPGTPGTNPGTTNPGTTNPGTTNPGTGTNPGTNPDTGTNPGTGGGNSSEIVLNDIAGHWAASAVQGAVEAGFVKGYANGQFRPDQAVNRVEFVTMLARALKLSDTGKNTDFKDSDKIPAWAKSFVAQAVESGIISGYGDGSFGPDKRLNRAEMVAMIVRASGIKVDPNAKLSFADTPSIPAWAVPYIATAVDAGLVSGISKDRFAPEQTATRAEAVALIVRLLNT